jgi:hypothetical protein
MCLTAVAGTLLKYTDFKTSGSPKIYGKPVKGNVKPTKTIVVLRFPGPGPTYLKSSPVDVFDSS